MNPYNPNSDKHLANVKKSLFTSSVLVAEVREPPYVAQADDLPRHSQEELSLARPLAPGVQAVVFDGFFTAGEAPLVELIQQRVSLLRSFVSHHWFWRRHAHTPEARKKKGRREYDTYPGETKHNPER